MNRKPRILLIPDVSWWIIGEMGKQIIARFNHKYDFYFVPEGLFERRPDLLQTFLPAVDMIHCLNESSIELFRALDTRPLPPIATWIHHVTHWSPQHELAVAKSAALTVCTPQWRDYLDKQAHGRIPITVVPHGVDLQFFSRKRANLAKFGIPKGRTVVGFIGAKGSDFDQGRKGTDVLLDVIRNAAKELPDLHIVLCGPGWEKELDGLRQARVSASATGYISKADLPILYSSLDIYLVTSRVEGGPCTVFEAMACGTPVVSTRVGAVPDLIVNGVNGYSAEIDDREGLLGAIIELARSPVRRSETSKNARQTISHFPWETVLSPLEGAYDSLIAQGSRDAMVDPAPRWMSGPKSFSRASSAADVLANITTNFQKGRISAIQVVPMVLRMLRGYSFSDAVKGFAMWRGLAYKER